MFTDKYTSHSRGRVVGLLALVLGLFLPVSNASAAVGGGSSGGFGGDPELYELQAGAQWSVVERVDAASNALPGDPNNDSFAVFPASAVDELEAQGILPALEAQEIRDDLAAEGLNYLEVDDTFVVHIEAAEAAAAEQLRGGTSGELAEKGCWGWQAPTTVSDQWTWNDSTSLDILQVDEPSFDGEVTIDLPVSATVDASVEYKVKKWACVPYKFRLIEAVIDGNANLDGSISATAELDYTHEWKWKHNLYTIKLGGFTVSLGPIPVYLSFKLPIDVGIDTKVQVGGNAELEANLTANANFNVTCTSSDCTGTRNFTHDFDVPNPTYEFTVDATAKVWAKAAVKMEVYDDSLGKAEVSATAYVKGNLYGYAGNQCGDADGNGTNESFADLLFSLDAGYEIKAGLGGLLLPDKEWKLLYDSFHLGFWDLYTHSSGHNLLDPIVTGPSQADAGESVSYTVKTRPCYPYDDDVDFTWSGPFSGGGSAAPKTGSVTASGLPAAGDHVVTFTRTGDDHGRNSPDYSVTRNLSVNYPDFDLPQAYDRFSRAVAGGDFDCDGHDDLAIGVPWEDAGAGSNTGLVTVVFSDGSNGLPDLATGRVQHIFNRSSEANSVAGANFGHSLAVGDFNGDGCDDLAASAPWDLSNAGMVQILYGDVDLANTLTIRDEIFLGNASFPGTGAYNDRLGDRLAAGDLDGDGFDDLAMTIPGRNNTVGAVLVAYGSALGTYDTGKEALIDQNSPGVPGVSEIGDGNDMSVAIGDLDGDGFGDLAIGYPREDFRATDDGYAIVLYGTGNGFPLYGNEGFGQSEIFSGGGGTQAENADRFGYALAIGDFDGDGIDDLSVGSYNEAWGSVTRTGCAHAIFGSTTGLNLDSGVKYFTQSSFGMTNTDPAYFASAITAGDFDGDGHDDLAFGAYAKSIFFDWPGPGLASFAGETYVAYGQANGTFVTRESNGGTDGHVFSRATPGFDGPQASAMYTGYSLGHGDFDGDGSDDLVVGSMGTKVNDQTQAGSCNVLYGHPSGLSTVGALHLVQND